MKLRIVRDDDTNKLVAIALQFGTMTGAPPWAPRINMLQWEEKSRFFPGILSFHVRDQLGINPGVIWSVMQFGLHSPEMPHGYRGTYRSLFLFGDRLGDEL